MSIYKKKERKKTYTKRQPSKGTSGPYSFATSGTLSLGTNWGSYSVSSSSTPFVGGAWTQPRQNIDLNNTDFAFKLLDGTEKTLTAKEYFDFIAYNGMTPGDCKDEIEYMEKVMAIKL